jgi:hypothetical protein
MRVMKDSTSDNDREAKPQSEIHLTNGKHIDNEIKEPDPSVPACDITNCTSSESNPDQVDSLDDDRISITLPVCWMTEDHI